jgi:hypothetical protein
MSCWSCRRYTDFKSANYCSWCGALVTHNNVHSSFVPYRSGGAVAKLPLSPRHKGLRQGALVMLSTLFLPFIVLVGAVFTSLPFELVPLTAILCFVGGLMRIFYALLLEEGTVPGPHPEWRPSSVPYFQPASVAHPTIARTDARASRKEASIPLNFERLPSPPSVTENTTRLLYYPGNASAISTKRE